MYRMCAFQHISNYCISLIAIFNAALHGIIIANANVPIDTLLRENEFFIPEKKPIYLKAHVKPHTHIHEHTCGVLYESTE